MTSIALGRYQLERRLAVGGMAEVLLAYIDGPEGFRRPVVIKRLLPHVASKPDVVTMFLNEARIAARFDHPNLVQVFELFEAAGQYCIAMELLDGIDARTLLERGGKLSAAAVCALVGQAAAGLHHAHELRGEDGDAFALVHRDVSPSNVFITRGGVVKVVDFGIARRASTGAHDVTAVRGKPSYMAPEQLQNEPLDRRTDIFGLGVVSYELLTGRPCFRGSFAEVMRQIVSGTKKPILELAPDAPAELVAIIERMMATRRDDRYATAADARADLRRVQAQLGKAGHELAELLDLTVFATAPAVRVPTAVADAETTIVSGALASPTTPITDHLLKMAATTPRRSRSPRAAVVVGIVASVGIVALLASRGERMERADAPPSAVAPAPAEPQPESLAEARPVPEPEPPTPPQSAVPPPPLATASGALTITSTQPSVVFARGKRLGATPLTITVRPGKTALRVVTASGAAKTVSVQVAPGARVEQHVTFAPGKLVVDAKPWAEVYLAGRKLGVTPLREQELLEGDYELSLRNPQLGVTREVRFTVRPGAVTKVFETLR